jgi:hypothetical protein
MFDCSDDALCVYVLKKQGTLYTNRLEAALNVTEYTGIWNAFYH